MRIAILSDIHSNLHALEAVLRDAEKRSPDKYYCLGDSIGYGAFPAQCLEIVRMKCEESVFGNHEYALLYPLHSSTFNNDAKAALEFTRANLTEDDFNWLSALQPHLILDGITLVHGSLRDFDEYVSDATIARLSLEIQKTRLLFAGHTHYPEGYLYDVETRQARALGLIGEGKVNIEKTGFRYLVNAGSVGQPRDGDPRASYVMFDTEKLEIEIIRLEYDIKAAADAIRDKGLPEFQAKRLFAGR